MDLFKKAKNFKGQDYAELKKQQLNRGVQFVDDEFPLEAMGIQSVPLTDIELKRPTELVPQPCLSSTESYSSLRKGFVHNFNILLAFTSLKYCPKLWSKVFVDVDAQNYNPEHPNEHPGIFRLRIWQEGSFVDVTIDDRLPCSKGKLLSTASSYPSEFWPALLEKAYAKLMGGYEHLEYMRLDEILMDLTGGVTECISFENMHNAPAMKQVEFYEKLEQALDEGTLVLLCTDVLNSSPNPDSKNGSDVQSSPNSLSVGDHNESTDFCAPGPLNSQMDQQTGLCARYGYLLTRLCTVPKDTSLFGAFLDVFRRIGDCPIRTRLLRLRCPLTVVEGGSGLGEWTGAYSSTSREWEELGLDVRRRLRLAFDSEAEFWIPLPDVLRCMAGAVICRLPETGLISLKGRTWQLNEHHGAWHGHQTGGSIRYRDTFLDNPQYTFDITNDVEEVLLALVRKYDRDPITLAIEPNGSTPAIGMGLFQVEKNRTTRLHRLAFARIVCVEAAKPYRVALIRCLLPIGRFVLIPFLEEPLSVAAYLLRLYLPKRTVSRELTLDVPPSSAFDFFHGAFKQAVRLHIHSASNLLWPDGKNPPSPYCIVNTEDNPIRTVVRNGTNNPIWDEYFLFYRRRPTKVPITIVIMDKRTIGFDVFLGRHCFKETEITQPGQQEVMLYGRDTKDERFVRMKGSLFVEFHVVSSEDFMQI